MIEDKDILESRAIIIALIKEGVIIKANTAFAGFFMKKSEDALTTAQLLHSLTKEQNTNFNIPKGYNPYSWIINSGYYSMFYAATSLLAHCGHRIKTNQGIHKITYNALVYYFLDNDKKLTKHILREYKKAEQDAENLLQIAEREARNRVEQVKHEIKKREEFTYFMGMIAEEDKAITSINRAKEFLTLVKELTVS